MGNGYIVVSVIASVCVAAAATAAALLFMLPKKSKKKTLIAGSVKVPLRLIDRNYITHDTIFLKFALPTFEHVLGLPVGNHVRISTKINDQTTARSYTPVSLDVQQGYVDFVIKVYKPNEMFSKGGLMSQHLASIDLESYVDVSGPYGNLEYKENGIFHIKRGSPSRIDAITVKKLNMICGGSGITPMYQMLNHILSSKNNEISIFLLFANQTEKDIILRNELEALASKHVDCFRFWYTVSDAAEHWKYSKGYIDEQMLCEHIFPPGENTLTVICGPPPMVERACLPNLTKLNYAKDHIHVF